MRSFTACRYAALLLILAALLCDALRADDAAETYHEVSFQTSDGGTVFANLYGAGDHAVVLAHGAVFDKESWHDQAVILAGKGMRVLAIDFRGYGNSKSGSVARGLHLDVLAGVRYLRQSGAKRVSVIGGSMGGGAAAQASIEASEGEIDDLILLAHSPVQQPQKLKGRKLFLVSRGDGLRRRVQQQFEAAPQPKRLSILDGSAHAQHIFRTDHGEELMDQLTAWLRDGPADEDSR